MIFTKFKTLKNMYQNIQIKDVEGFHAVFTEKYIHYIC